MNAYQAIGRLVADPELVYLPTGTPKTTFRIAVQRRLKKEQRNNDHVQQADFITVRAFKRTAEIVSEHFGKGDPIAIEGELRIDQYDTQDRGRQYFTYVLANRVHFVGSKRTASDEVPHEEPAEPGEEAEPAAVAAASETDEPW